MGAQRQEFVMKVKDMMHRGAEYVAPNAKLQVIAKKMRDYDVGALPVCDGGKTIGMITDLSLIHISEPTRH